MDQTDLPVAELVNAEGSAPVCLVCEHASPFIPANLDDLGLLPRHRRSHAVFDIGAELLARHLAASLDAPLVLCRVSRLVYDCNRPPERDDAIPTRVEDIDIPGNRGLTAGQRAERVAKVYDPFHDTVSKQLDRMTANPAFVTLHSFTPTWLGSPRGVEIGILNDVDESLAASMLAVAPSAFRVEANQPYSAADGVTHTLQKHAGPRGLANVMIEIRNDLLTTDEQIANVSATLTKMLLGALEKGIAA